MDVVPDGIYLGYNQVDKLGELEMKFIAINYAESVYHTTS